MFACSEHCNGATVVIYKRVTQFVEFWRYRPETTFKNFFSIFAENTAKNTIFVDIKPASNFIHKSLNLRINNIYITSKVIKNFQLVYFEYGRLLGRRA
jgi:hypothetical protein